MHALKKKVPSITINNKQHAIKNKKINVIIPFADSSIQQHSQIYLALRESPFNSDEIKGIVDFKFNVFYYTF